MAGTSSPISSSTLDSPLLHTRFRGSTVTEPWSENSYYYQDDGPSGARYHSHVFDDDASVYSNTDTINANGSMTVDAIAESEPVVKEDSPLEVPVSPLYPSGASAQWLYNTSLRGALRVSDYASYVPPPPSPGIGNKFGIGEDMADPFAPQSEGVTMVHSKPPPSPGVSTSPLASFPSQSVRLATSSTTSGVTAGRAGARRTDLSPSPTPSSSLQPSASRQLALPTVIVSSPSDSKDAYDGQADVDAPVVSSSHPSQQSSSAGRVRTQIANGDMSGSPSVNFSRPYRPPPSPLQLSSPKSSINVSAPDSARPDGGEYELESRKRAVLERNAYRSRTPTPNKKTQFSASRVSRPNSPLITPSPPEGRILMNGGIASPSWDTRALSPSPSRLSPSPTPSQFPSSSRADPERMMPSPSSTSSPLPTVVIPSPLQHTQLLSASPMSTTSTRSELSPRTPQDFALMPLPSRPPISRKSASENDVPSSPYSNYSYYDFNSRPSTPTRSPRDATPSPILSLGSPKPADSVSSAPSSPRTPDEYLQLGITHHEANRLKESALCFKKSATEMGGCPAGMLMWGLSLRHAWGCEEDRGQAFRWLKRAAESAVGNLEGMKMIKAGKSGRDAVKVELVLAVYEVGQSFFHGWGVPQDKKMGVSYFKTAAELGDADAQQDLAFCLANGKGCKKDKKAAAKWYRAAAAQGASTVGLAWIYKSKYAE